MNERSEVVELMRKGKEAAWEAWWAHAKRRDRPADYEFIDRALWAAFEEAADAFHLEVETRAAISRQATA